jgi:hypothetical protein
MATSDLRAWAVKGAEQRLVEIAAEAKAIVSAFPELRKRGGFKAPPSGQESASTPAEAPTLVRQRRKMSAEARKRIGDAQRKRWAAKRQQDAKAEAPASGAAGPKAGRKRGRAKVK